MVEVAEIKIFVAGKVAWVLMPIDLKITKNMYVERTGGYYGDSE